MFSLPAPVPAQVNNIASSSVNRSNSATLPYPTLQSVTTPSVSRARGDWGFKRPFPLKSTTKTTTPIIRVKQVDTPEHVTDFASAADHSLSLQKFHEMNIPVVMPPLYKPSTRSINVADTTPRKSVFEEIYDVTDIAPADRLKMSEYRWRFDGPWLAGMAEGEFSKYLRDKVKPRRAEFRQWLKGIVAQEMNQEADARAMENGEADKPSNLTAADVTDEQFTARLCELREDRVHLYKLVGRFLDLAPIAPKTSKIPEQTGKKIMVSLAPAMNPYTGAGPPITHPSAGLSYLRSGAFIENHPLYGPQESHRHVASRVLLSSSGLGTASNANVNVNIGLGGFVTNPPTNDAIFNNKSNLRFNPDQFGGQKHYVEPLLAVIDSRGNVKITAKPSQPEAVIVAKELDGVKMNGGAAAKVRNDEQSRREKATTVKEKGFRTWKSGKSLNSGPEAYGFPESRR